MERWLSYKGTCHVILLAKLHDMYLYKTDNFFHIKHYLKSVSKVALLHRFYCSHIIAIILKCQCNVCPLYMGRVQRKKSLQTWAKYADLNHPAHARSPIRAFAFHWDTLWYPTSLIRLRMPIWAFSVRICPKTRFRMVHLIVKNHADFEQLCWFF